MPKRVDSDDPDEPGIGSIERQRRRYKAAGLVQINVWIPAENRNELLEDCARLRWAHLKHVGYPPEPRDE